MNVCQEELTFVAFTTKKRFRGFWIAETKRFADLSNFDPASIRVGPQEAGGRRRHLLARTAPILDRVQTKKNSIGLAQTFLALKGGLAHS